jgi:hypothetical protein
MAPWMAPRSWRPGSDPGVHSIYRILNGATAHPEFFNKDALRARKLGVPGGAWDFKNLDVYVANAWEPTVRDLRMLKKALAPHKAKFDAIYKPIRDQIAHIILKDEGSVADLYSRTLKTDIDEILCFLHSLVKAIWHLAFNAHRPKLTQDNYGYAGRVAQNLEGNRADIAAAFVTTDSFAHRAVDYAPFRAVLLRSRNAPPRNRFDSWPVT